MATLLGVTPAAAHVQTVGASRVGLQPRSTELYEDEAAGEYEATTKKLTRQPVEVGGVEFANPEGRPVVSSAKVYAIYWSPAEDIYHGDWQHLINGFFYDMSQAGGSLGNAFAVDTQYTDAEGAHATDSPAFASAYTDFDPYPEAEAACVDPNPLSFIQPKSLHPDVCLSGKQIEAELQRFIKSRSLPTGLGTIYYLLTPPGVTDCLIEEGGKEDCSDYSGQPEASNVSYRDSFCSYHSDINPGSPSNGGPETILYAAIPWTAGGLGNYDLAEADRTPAHECQDGGLAKAEPMIQEEPNQSAKSPDGGYDTGLADLIVGQIASEQQNIVTDPLLNAWQTHAPGGGEGGGNEATDLCRDFFTPTLGGEAKKQEGTEAGTLYNEELYGGRYYLNNAFDLAAVRVGYPGVPCLKSVSLAPEFTSPARVNAGEVVGFDGMESDIVLDAGTAYAEGKPVTTYPTFEWSFGDGTTVKGLAPSAPFASHPTSEPCEESPLDACAGSAFHTYAYGGTYEVTLTVTDAGGNVASVTKKVTVDGPPPPASSSGGGSVSAAPVSSPSPSGASKPTKRRARKAAKAPLPRPVATAIITTTSLRNAIEDGLKVRYSVNQQVAGHFEVLIPTRVARRLKIKGKPATGLPRGEPRQTLIAYALLITTRKAHGTMSIVIPPQTGSRMARLRHVTLTLRLEVRNASRSQPKKTLLQTAAKLRR